MCNMFNWWLVLYCLDSEQFRAIEAQNPPSHSNSFVFHRPLSLAGTKVLNLPFFITVLSDNASLYIIEH